VKFLPNKINWSYRWISLICRQAAKRDSKRTLMRRSPPQFRSKDYKRY